MLLRCLYRPYGTIENYKNAIFHKVPKCSTDFLFIFKECYKVSIFGYDTSVKVLVKP